MADTQTTESRITEKSQWLSLRDACRLLDVSDTTLRQWADSGYLRVYRTPGGHRRFLREDVDSFASAPGQAQEQGGRTPSRSRPSARFAVASAATM